MNVKLPFGFRISRRRPDHERMSSRPKRRIDAVRYDAASTSRHNARHWMYATAGDADSVISPNLTTLRNRARYEIRNNCNAKGIVETFANELIGTGPGIQVNSGDPDYDRAFEEAFTTWSGDGDYLDEPQCDRAGKQCLADILRLAASIQIDECGEGFILMQTDTGQKSRAFRGVYGGGEGVRLKLLVIEPDRVATPLGMIDGQKGVSGGIVNQGIECDEFGKPLNYYVLKKHPGSNLMGDILTGIGDYDVVEARYMIHIARPDRPGQTRGVPRMTPSLPLWAQLRRFTLATLGAAETAANLSGTLNAASVDGDDDDITYEAMDTVEMERNSLLITPDGTEAKQFKAEHPATTYKEFRGQIINEAARPHCMPLNIASGDSSDYNYASGRLDHQSFHKEKAVLRKWIARHPLRTIVRTWRDEAVLVPGYLPPRKLPDGARRYPRLKVSWLWPGDEHVDPIKEARAQEIRLTKSNTTTLAAEYGRQGKDWEAELTQRAKEQRKMEELGLSTPVEKTNQKPELGSKANGKQTA